VFKGDQPKSKKELLRYYLNLDGAEQFVGMIYLDCDYCEETRPLLSGLKMVYIVCFFQKKSVAKTLNFWER